MGNGRLRLRRADHRSVPSDGRGRYRRGRCHRGRTAEAREPRLDWRSGCGSTRGQRRDDLRRHDCGGDERRSTGTGAAIGFGAALRPERQTLVERRARPSGSLPPGTLRYRQQTLPEPARFTGHDRGLGCAADCLGAAARHRRLGAAGERRDRLGAPASGKNPSPNEVSRSETNSFRAAGAGFSVRPVNYRRRALSGLGLPRPPESLDDRTTGQPPPGTTAADFGGRWLWTATGASTTGVSSSSTSMVGISSAVSSSTTGSAAAGLLRRLVERRLRLRRGAHPVWPDRWSESEVWPTPPWPVRACHERHRNESHRSSRRLCWTRNSGSADSAGALDFSSFLSGDHRFRR